MAYVITQNCCNDASCVAACPVGCIHPNPDEREFATTEMLYIDPTTCIDCGACADACPVDAITPDTDLTPATEPYARINREYYRTHVAAPTFRRSPQPVPLVTSRDSLRVAIVGSGPAGQYCAQELLAHPGVEIDMYERLSVPFGLARYGVAPDHPATRAVVDQFAFSPRKRRRVRLHLGVDVGTDLRHGELMAGHDAVVYAHGAFHERVLEIPGARTPGSFAAASIVGWYNGHPGYRGLTPPLHERRAVVIGNGNVSLDIARILVTDPADLAHTEIASSALDALRTNRIEEVVIVGRRGAEHAAFTLPELLALSTLRGVDVVVDPADLPACSTPTLRLLADIAAMPRVVGNKRISLRFGTTPVEICGDASVTGLRTGTSQIIETGLVVHAIGFRGQPIPDVPFDRDSHTIPHRAGRVVDPADGEILPGVYTAGWIKRGPTGVIGTNRTCAAETVGSLLADHSARLLRRNAHEYTTVR